MEKITLFSVLLILLVFGTKCSKKDQITSEDIIVNLETKNGLGEKTNQFPFEEDITFIYSETNQGTQTISYYGNHCASLSMKLYDHTGNLIGRPNDPEIGCTEILLLQEIESTERKEYSINWFDNPTNDPLPIGDYVIRIAISISIPAISSNVDHELSYNFKVY